MKKINNESDVNEQKNLNEEYYDSNTRLTDLLQKSPIPKSELSRNLFLYLDRRALSRFLFLNEIYTLGLKLHGSIFEFGVRYGVNTSLFTSLRGIHEPFNHNRKIIAYDTFAGFPTVSKYFDKAVVAEGEFSVPPGYELHLEEVLSIHEKLAPIESVKKFELIKGDVTKTLPHYLEKNPHTLISLAYFDFDLYEPTLFSLETIEPYLTDNAVIAFDELNVENWPGETKAVREWIGDRNMPVLHSNYRAAAGYILFRK